MSESKGFVRSLIPMVFSFFNKSVAFLEDEAVKRAIQEVIDQKTYYGYGNQQHVKEFEKMLSTLFDSTYVSAMNSGTDALITALKILNIKNEDEVIVPAFGFISTASCISFVGATPVFVDIQLDDCSIDVAKIEERITPRTKAIIVAHLFGRPALGIINILSIAKKYGICVVEDAAQSFGAKILVNGEWKLVGTLGDIGCLSFSSTKPFSAPGNGGALLTQNRALHEEANKMRFYGAKVHYYDYTTSGGNYKMHDIQAAALLAKYRFYGHWLEHRQKIADYYSMELTGVGDLVLPQRFPNIAHIWSRYVVKTKQRDALFDYLLSVVKKFGQWERPLKNYPVPLPYFSVFKHLGHKRGDFPMADQFSQEGISLPISNYGSLNDAKLISNSVKEFFKQGK